MKSNTTPQTISQNSPSYSSASFGIAEEGLSTVLLILRQSIYSDPLAAVLREYISNAWDEHAQAGIPDTPLEIQMPTREDPLFKCRDFGRGLSEEQVYGVYIQYANSTKRNTNKAVGFLGIGAKCAFAVSPQFTVISYHGGFKSVYLAALDNTNKGTMSLLSKIPSDETGVEVQVSIPSESIRSFTESAQQYLPFIAPTPNVTGYTKPIEMVDPLSKGVCWGWDNRPRPEGLRGWYVVMGCIPYGLDLDKLQGELGSNYGKLIGEFGYVKVPVGSISFAASREEVTYTKQTIRLISTALNELVERYLLDLGERLNKAVTDWDKLLIALEGRWKLKVSLGALGGKNKLENLSYILLKDLGNFKSFFPRKEKVYYDSKSRIVVLDDSDKRKRNHFNHPTPVLLIKPSRGFTQGQAIEEIQVALKEKGLRGLPVTPYDETDTQVVYKTPPSYVTNANKKHKSTRFVFNGQTPTPASRSWDSLGDREPKDGDPFVILSHFKPIGNKESNFFAFIHDELATFKRIFGREPTIYGFKNTSRNKITVESFPHLVPWHKWKVDAIQEAWDKKNLEILSKLRWFLSLHNSYTYKITFRENDIKAPQFWESKFPPTSKTLEVLKEGLGKGHLIYQFFKQSILALTYLQDLDGQSLNRVTRLTELGYPENYKCPILTHLSKIYEVYPMLSLTDRGERRPYNLREMLYEHPEKTLAYIKFVDSHQNP